MEDLEKFIKERLQEIEELYDFYLDKLDRSFDFQEQIQYETRLRELRIEKRTLENILRVMNGEE